MTPTRVRLGISSLKTSIPLSPRYYQKQLQQQQINQNYTLTNINSNIIAYTTTRRFHASNLFNGIQSIYSSKNKTKKKGPRNRHLKSKHVGYLNNTTTTTTNMKIKTEQPLIFDHLLKDFILKVHPDKWVKYPEYQALNSENLQQLNNFIACFKRSTLNKQEVPYPPAQTFKLRFLVRDESQEQQIIYNNYNNNNNNTNQNSQSTTPNQVSQGQSFIEVKFVYFSVVLSGGDCKKIVGKAFMDLFMQSNVFNMNHRRIGNNSMFNINTDIVWGDKYWYGRAFSTGVLSRNYLERKERETQRQKDAEKKAYDLYRAKQ